MDLFSAIYKGDVGGVRAALDQGADPNGLDRRGSSRPLHYALKHAPTATVGLVTDLLISYGADVNGRTTWGATPLSFAAGGGRVGIVKRLLSLGADIDVPDRFGRTALDEAVSNEKWDAARLLMDRGARVSIHCAAGLGATDTLRRLVSQGSNVNGRNGLGQTPLHWALDDKTVEVLVQLGADPHARDNSGETPLYPATRRARLGVIEALIRCGADVNARNNSRDSPLDYASRADVAGLLTKHGGVR